MNDNYLDTVLFNYSPARLYLDILVVQCIKIHKQPKYDGRIDAGE